MRSFFSAKRRWWKDAILKIKMRKKLPAFTLVATSLAVLTWILIAQSFAMMSSGAMDTAKTQRVTAQAVEAAKLDEAALRNIAYDEIDAKGPHERRAIEGMDDGSWESSVTIAPEKTLSDGERTKVKMATISIYRVGDTVSRFSLDVPLVSSDFNVKNDDEKHRISQQYDETHKTVDTVVDRKVIYDNVKNDTPGHRISLVWDEEKQTVRTLVDGEEKGGQGVFVDFSRPPIEITTSHRLIGGSLHSAGNESFVAPANGFVVFANLGSEWNPRWADAYINGYKVNIGYSHATEEPSSSDHGERSLFRLQKGTLDANHGNVLPPLPVKQGDVISISGGSCAVYAYFFYARN